MTKSLKLLSVEKAVTEICIMTVPLLTCFSWSPPRTFLPPCHTSPILTASFLRLQLKIKFKLVVWAILGSSSVFLGISHIHGRYTCFSPVNLFFFFFMGSGGLNQEPRRVEGQSFFFPYNDSMLSFTHSLAIIHSFIYSCMQQAVLIKGLTHARGFSGGSVVKNLPINGGDTDSVPGLGKPPGERNVNTFQYSCLGNPMDR